jgi:ribosomal protein L35AE/L33A
MNDITYNLRYNVFQADQSVPEMVEEYETCERYNKAQAAAGKVAVYREKGELCLSYKGRVQTFRGSSVDGCDASDEFVQHLAREWKKNVDETQ